MKIERFTISDLDTLRRWLSHYYDLSQMHNMMLSSIGFIADGCAAGFLFDTGTGQMYLDRLISDPEAAPLRRGRAVKAVLKRLEEEAVSRGAVAITAVTSNAQLSLNKTLENMGFRDLGLYNFRVKMVDSKEKTLCRG